MLNTQAQNFGFPFVTMLDDNHHFLYGVVVCFKSKNSNKVKEKHIYSLHTSKAHVYTYF